MSVLGGDARNPFGKAVEAVVAPGSCSPFWGPALAALDSDCDGKTNGEELQDPGGAWVPGTPNPGDLSLVTRPGDGVCLPPAITRQSGDITIPFGKNVNAQVEATGFGPLSYRWQRNGVDQPANVGGTSPTLFIEASSNPSETVQCFVTNAGGTTPSAVINVTKLAVGDYVSQLTAINNPAGFVGSTVQVSITLMNTGTFSWSQDVALDITDVPGTLPVNLAVPSMQNPWSVVTPAGSSRVFTFPVKMPDSPGLYYVDLQLVETRFFTDIVQRIPFGENFRLEVTAFDAGVALLTGSPPGWLGGVVAGNGSVSTGNSGLCMTAPATGDNIVGWVSPEGFIPLIDNAVVRIQVAPTTTQSATDSIPLWDIVYDNFNSDGFGNTYGGESLYLDGSGGANGIGRGRANFQTWAMPVAAETLQWRGLLPPPEDNSNSAFTPAADSANDMRVIFRALDLDSAGILAQNDSGTICVSGMVYEVFPLAGMSSIFLWGPTIAGTTFAPQTNTQQAEHAGVAYIDEENDAANYTLAAGGVPGSRKTLIPFDASLFDAGNPGALRPLYPIFWESDKLFKGSINIEMGLTGAAGGAKSLQKGQIDPPDAIFVNSDTPTNELVNIHAALVGSPGNMYHASSPLPASATGGSAQPYSSFFYGHNVTSWDLSLLPDADRFRFQGDFFNTTDINQGQFGGSPFAVRAMIVQQINALR